MAEKGAEEETGARGLIRVCERVLRDYKYSLPDHPEKAFRSTDPPSGSEYWALSFTSLDKGVENAQSVVDGKFGLLWCAQRRTDIQSIDHGNHVLSAFCGVLQ